MSAVACKISTAEWRVMKESIQTLMGRLVKKQALGIDKNSATLYQYYPLVSHEACMREETKSFLHKVYGDSLHLLLTNFVKDESLSPQEIGDLGSLLGARLT